VSEEEQEITIPEEQAIDQRIVPFEGDDLAAAMSQSGSIYVSLPGICRALGISRSQHQVQRIARTRSLAKGLRRIPLKTAGGTQKVNCLRIDRVALWLAGIETDRIDAKYRAKIETYQDDLADVATALFLQHINAPVPIEQDDRATLRLLIDHLTALVAMPEQLDQVITLLSRLTEQSETTAVTVASMADHLTPEQKRKVAAAVKKINEDTRDAWTLGHIYGELKEHFCVARYDEIPATRFEDVMVYLRGMWKEATSGKLPEQGDLF
jgi:hypothetical protein